MFASHKQAVALCQTNFDTPRPKHAAALLVETTEDDYYAKFIPNFPESFQERYNPTLVTLPITTTDDDKFIEDVKFVLMQFSDTAMALVCPPQTKKTRSAR